MMTPKRQQAHLRMMTNFLGCLYCKDSEIVWDLLGPDAEKKCWEAAQVIRNSMALTNDEYIAFIEKGCRKICVTIRGGQPMFAHSEDVTPVTVVNVASSIPQTVST